MIHICDVPRYHAIPAEELKEMRENHVLLKSFSYEKTPIQRGYTDKILTVDVGTKEIKIADIPAEVKEKFTGGKGYCLRRMRSSCRPARSPVSPSTAAREKP